MDLPLSLCRVVYVPKDGRRKKHELRFSLPGGEALVLAVQSKEQAEGWLTVLSRPSTPRSFTLLKLGNLTGPAATAQVCSRTSLPVYSAHAHHVAPS